MGADWGPLSLSGQWWRPLTSTFVHFSRGHVLGNMLFLWIFGKRLERVLGKWTYLFFYLGCGVMGSIFGLAFYPDGIQGGASAGVFGLGGGLISVYGIKVLTLPKRARWKLVLLIAWVAFTVYPNAGEPEVNNAAHAGGLLMGLVLGALLTSRLADPQRQRWVFAGMTCVLLLGGLSVRLYHRDVAKLGKAASYMEAGRWDEALGELNAVLRKNPGHITANVWTAGVYMEKEDDANAERAARRVLNLDPDDDSAVSILATVELRTGRCNEADSLVGARALRSRDPFHFSQRFLFTHCNYLAQGDRYLSDGEVDLAIHAYEDAAKEHKNEYEAEVKLAKAYEAAGKTVEAKAAAARAIEIQQRVSQHQ